MSNVKTLDLKSWQPQIDEAQRAEIALALEQGKVLYLPHLQFVMHETERVFLSPAWLTGKRKNISLDHGVVQGAQGSPEALTQLAGMVGRFERQANEFVAALFIRYRPYLRGARASFRPSPTETPVRSWRKDDTRLHVDAFPSRPNHGERILRVFSNVNPVGVPRIWRVGEPFEDAARHFLPTIARPFPGSALLLRALGITKTRRSEYDHIMLALHDRMKADPEYQRNAPQEIVELQAGGSWVCFSDQVLHAAVSGQYMFEQTLHLPVEAQYHPEASPLKTLERLRGYPLV